MTQGGLRPPFLLFAPGRLVGPASLCCPPRVRPPDPDLLGPLSGLPRGVTSYGRFGERPSTYTKVYEGRNVLKRLRSAYSGSGTGGGFRGVCVGLWVVCEILHTYRCMLWISGGARAVIEYWADDASQTIYMSKCVGVAKIGLAVLLGSLDFHVNAIYGGGKDTRIEQVFDCNDITPQVFHYISLHIVHVRYRTSVCQVGPLGCG